MAKLNKRKTVYALSNSVILKSFVRLGYKRMTVYALSITVIFKSFVRLNYDDKQNFGRKDLKQENSCITDDV